MLVTKLMGFAMAEVPLEREFQEGELREEMGRGKRPKRAKEDKIKK